MTYYNTNDESGDELARSQHKASDQEIAVMAFFASSPGPWPPHHVRDSVLPEAPLTSVRRAMTNLTKIGYLQKSGHMVIGTYGKYVNTWRLAPR